LLDYAAWIQLYILVSMHQVDRSCLLRFVPGAGSDAAADTELEFGALEGTIDEVLDAGVERLKERTTWKLWTWPAEETEFTDAEAFRGFVTDKHVREELRKYLPRDDPKTPERPAEEGFRKRM
jgi:hypothetical protein